jgi:hypothetical protein
MLAKARRVRPRARPSAIQGPERPPRTQSWHRRSSKATESFSSGSIDPSADHAAALLTVQQVHAQRTDGRIKWHYIY